MQVFRLWFSLFLLAVCALAEERPSELRIDSTHRPNDCTELARPQDTVEVHYVGNDRLLLMP